MIYCHNSCDFLSIKKNKQFREEYLALRSFAYVYYYGYYSYLYVLFFISCSIGFLLMAFGDEKLDVKVALFVSSIFALIIAWVSWILGKACMNCRR